MANKNDIGYVYIFTNESFREGWIKIGKTKNIKKRLNDLDNTSCPLPFDVYATLKTTRYEEAETFVHEFISHFNRDLRVRPNREYFKVSPKEALEILYQVKKMMNEEGSEIKVYDEKCQKFASQMEKKHKVKRKGKTEASNEENKVEISTSPINDGPRLLSMTTLPAYVNNLKSDKTKGVLAQMGLDTDISKIIEQSQLSAVQAAIKAMEKSMGMHHTHSCAMSRYTDYIKAGLRFNDMEHDAALVKGIKQLEKRAEEVKSNIERRKPAPPFKFSMIDMPVGTTITFLPTGVQVKVASNDTIEYQGKTYSLTGFCKEFMPEEKRIPTNAYQGPAFFTYQGKTLKKIRMEIENK